MTSQSKVITFPIRLSFSWGATTSKSNEYVKYQENTD